MEKNPTAKIQSTDPDSSSFQNPLGPFDSPTVTDQAERAGVGQIGRREMVAKPGYYPPRQG